MRNNKREVLMFELSEAKIDKIVVHKIGNKLNKDGVELSNSLLEFDENLEALLLSYFLKSFKSKEEYHFTNIHDESEMNEIYRFTSDIFDNADELFDTSINVARHLYNQSTHPKVQGGDLFIAYFSGIEFNGETVETIGYFKSEIKDSFLKVTQEDNVFEIEPLTGINISKIDKGCLVFNSNRENGYKILSIDNNRSASKYWNEQFLGIERVYDNESYTKAVINTCDTFVKKVLPTKVEEPEKQDVIKDKIVKYLSDENQFEKDVFTSEVFDDSEIIEEFNELYEKKTKPMGTNANKGQFDIEKETVGKMIKKFDKIIKLDSDVEIKIKSSARNDEDRIIEKVYDEAKGLSYYKVWFSEEM